MRAIMKGGGAGKETALLTVDTFTSFPSGN
jgi:hypothetical protein